MIDSRMLVFAVALLGSPIDGAVSARADTFGSGGNSFAIDFVEIGNPGNPHDDGAGGGSYYFPYGGVPYVYRMGVTEVAREWIDKATTSGLENVSADVWTGNQPAGNMSWYEMAAFVNWLNSSTGHHVAYALTYQAGWTMNLWSSADAWQVGGENLYRHKDAYYFLPSIDEWYKAGFHKNDGVTANYWDYATRTNTTPQSVASGRSLGTAVWGSLTTAPAAVDNNGGLSPYGTRGQNGNVYEVLESAADGLNNSASELRSVRGGAFGGGLTLEGFWNGRTSPGDERESYGLRVASIPEPSVAVLVIAAGLPLVRYRRRLNC